MCDFDYLCFTKIGCGSAVFRSKASFWLATALTFHYLCKLYYSEKRLLHIVTAVENQK